LVTSTISFTREASWRASGPQACARHRLGPTISAAEADQAVSVMYVYSVRKATRSMLWRALHGGKDKPVIIEEKVEYPKLPIGYFGPPMTEAEYERSLRPKPTKRNRRKR
jgi:hypothetical protein